MEMPFTPNVCQTLEGQADGPAPQHRVCPVNLGAGEDVLSAPYTGRDSVGRTVLLGDED